MTKRRVEAEPARAEWPHSLEAEKAILGSLLINSAVYERVADRITASQFYRDAHRKIYEAMIALVVDQRVEVDLVALQHELTRRGTLEAVGGMVYVASLVDGLPHGTNVQHYAAIVQETARLRAVIHAGTRMVEAARAGDATAAAIIQTADTALLTLQAGTDASGFPERSQVLNELITDLDWRIANRGRLSGIESGFKSINDQTGGWQRGDVIVIGARPSIGKSSLAMNLARAAAELSGAKVCVFSLEMKRQQLEYRMISMLSQVPLTRILTGYLTEEMQQAVGMATTRLAHLPIAISDRSTQTAADIRVACRRMKNEQGLDMVVIDYVQLMQSTVERRGATRTEELSDVSRRLKVLAGELNVPIFVLSQLNRQAANVRPQISDLRECGSLEQDADLVCLLHRKNHQESGVTNFILAKQRNGPTGTINLMFDRDLQTFTDGGEETAAQVDARHEEERHAERTRAIIRSRGRGK